MLRNSDQMMPQPTLSLQSSNKKNDRKSECEYGGGLTRAG